MKAFIFLFFSLLFTFQGSFASNNNQSIIPDNVVGVNILEDARNLISHKDFDKVEQIIAAYNLKTKNGDNGVRIIDNAFLSSKEYKYPKNGTNGGLPDDEYVTVTSSGPSQSMGDVTKVAIGMARFLSDRAKAELNESFFYYMSKQLEKMPDLQFYFPETYDMLKQMRTNSTALNMDYLRGRFQQDVARFPDNLNYILDNINENSKYKNLHHFNRYLQTNDAGKLVNYGLKSMLKNKGTANPKEFIANFYDANVVQLENSINNHSYRNIINVIKLTTLISNSLSSTSYNQCWISQHQFQDLLSEDELFKAYIGLILAKSQTSTYSIKFFKDGGLSSNFQELVENTYASNGKVDLNKLVKLKNFIRSIYQTYSEADQLIENIRNGNVSDRIEDSYKLFNVLKENTNTINKSIGLNRLLGEDIEIDESALYTYLIPTTEMAYNMYAKKYNLVIRDFIEMLNKSSQLTDNGKEYKRFVSKFNTYGTLIANVAYAQNSDDVKSAIQASVLPVGSSRIKRHSNWSITANAFVGGFFGVAHYKEEVNNEIVDQSINTFGITAPIGLSINKGNLPFFNSKSALAINLQIVDLGSLVNFYMKSGDGAMLPKDTKIQLGDIIAPGLSLSYSLGDSPFSFIIGTQYVPNLSRIEQLTTNTNFKPLTWRSHIGLALDIPLFNLKVWN